MCDELGAELGATSAQGFVPRVKPRDALMAKPQRAMMRMVMPLALAFLDRIRPRHFLAIRPDDRPKEGLVGLADVIAREEFTIELHRDAGFCFLNGKFGRLSIGEAKEKGSKGKECFHAWQKGGENMKRLQGGKVGQGVLTPPRRPRDSTP